MKPKEYQKWLVCFGATILLFCAIGLTISAFSIYLPYIREVNGFNNTQASMLVTIRTLTSMIPMLFIDRYYQKIGFRVGILISMVGIALGFVLYGFASSYPVYCLASALCGGAMGLSSGTASSLLISSWFQEKRGTAIGIASAGSGVASIVSPVILVPLIENISLKFAFCVEGAFVLLCSAIVFAVVRNNPETQETQKGEDKPQKENQTENALLKTSGLSTAFLWVGVFLGGLIIYGVTATMSMVLKEHFTGIEMSRLISIYGAALMIGKVGYGYVADKLSTFVANIFMFAALFIGLAGCCFTHNFAFAVCMVFMAGLGSSLANVAVPIYGTDFAHEKSYPKVVKYFGLTMSVAGLFITTVAGPMADVFGSYVPVFAMLAVLTLADAVLIQFTYVKSKRKN